MREIKFRAWDSHSNEMIANEHLTVVSGKAAYSMEDGVPYVTPDIELMQFTGLQDKNGKDVFKDDLLKSGRTGLLYRVIWDDDKAAFTSLCVDPKRDFRMDPYSWGDAEIVGNIHESPEPLK